MSISLLQLISIYSYNANKSNVYLVWEVGIFLQEEALWTRHRPGDHPTPRDILTSASSPGDTCWMDQNPPTLKTHAQ